MSRLGLIVGLLVGCGQTLSIEGGEPVGGGSAGELGVDADPGEEIVGGGGPVFDHGPWDVLVARYVGPGCLDYAALAQSEVDLAALQSYLAALAAADPVAWPTRHDGIAFWVNAYNALTVNGVLAGLSGNPNFSTAGAGFDDFSFFRNANPPVAGRTLSLDQVEHGVLRGDRSHGAWDPALGPLHEALASAGASVDARLHAALNCGARSCPSLAAEAYVGAKLSEQLDRQAAAWVNDVTKGAGPGGISTLFQWYGQDFDQWVGGARAFVERYGDGGGAGVDYGTYLPYDWHLNACP